MYYADVLELLNLLEVCEFHHFLSKMKIQREEFLGFNKMNKKNNNEQMHSPTMTKFVRKLKSACLSK